MCCIQHFRFTKQHAIVRVEVIIISSKKTQGVTGEVELNGIGNFGGASPFHAICRLPLHPFEWNQ